MQALFLTLIVTFLATFHIHSNAMDDAIPKPTVLEPNLSISHQPYTTHQHFQDIKELLYSIKYQNPQNRKEYRTNEIIDTFIPFLNQKLLKEKNVFILNTIPFLAGVVKHPKADIPAEIQDLFAKKVIPLIEKRNLFLNRLTTIKE